MKLETDKNLTRNPFKLPDGYMDHLTEQIMTSLPDSAPDFELFQQDNFYRDYFRPALYVTAIVAGIFLSLSTHQFSLNSDQARQKLHANNTSIQEKSKMLNEFCDYVRLDQNDIYVYLSENK